MLGKVIIFILLFVSSLALSGEWSWFFVFTSLVSALIGLIAAVRMDLIRRLDVNYKIFAYWAWLIKQMFLSALDVIARVWGFKPISPAFVTLKTIQDNDIGYAIFGNSVTLTPGTVMIDMNTETAEVIVHSISEENLQQMQGGEMDRKVAATITDWGNK